MHDNNSDVAYTVCMAIRIASHQFDGLGDESDDRLEKILVEEFATLEHEELVSAQEHIEDLMLHQPGNRTFQKAISVLVEISVLKAQSSMLSRLKILAGQSYLSPAEAEDVAEFLTNEAVAKAVRLLGQVLGFLRKRADVIIPE